MAELERRFGKMRQCLRRTRIVLAVAVLFGVFVCSASALDAPCEDCGPGDHWVDQCPGGLDQIEDQGALIGIDMDLDCEEDVSLVMFPCLDIPPLTIGRSSPLDDSMNFPGLRSIDGHLDVIDTEIIEMCLAGGGFTLTAGAGHGQGGVLAPSLGAIAELVAAPDLAESFFDVYFEVEIPGEVFLYNQSPLRLATEIYCVPPDEAAYLHPTDCIPLYTSPFVGQGEHVANLTRAEHLVNPGPAPVEESSWGVIKALYR